MGRESRQYRSEGMERSTGAPIIWSTANAYKPCPPSMWPLIAMLYLTITSGDCRNCQSDRQWTQTWGLYSSVWNTVLNHGKQLGLSLLQNCVNWMVWGVLQGRVDFVEMNATKESNWDFHYRINGAYPFVTRWQILFDREDIIRRQHRPMQKVGTLVQSSISSPFQGKLLESVNEEQLLSWVLQVCTEENICCIWRMQLRL